MSVVCVCAQQAQCEWLLRMHNHSAWVYIICSIYVHTCMYFSSTYMQQYVLYISIFLQDKIVCLVCGTRNSADSTHCWTCEKPLPPDAEAPPSPIHTPPPIATPTVMRPISGSSYMMCGVCGRVNVSDARFCDWCGGKVSAIYIHTSLNSATLQFD